MISFSTASRQLQKARNQLPILIIPGTDEVYRIHTDITFKVNEAVLPFDEAGQKLLSLL